MNDTKIMIVDDSKINRVLLKEIIAHSHPEYVISMACSGEEALESLAISLPDIVLLDVMMPGIDGFEVCRRMKSDQRFSNIPVLMITALDKMEHKVMGFEAGAADYIIKPIDARETNARVDAHLKIKRYQDELIILNERLVQAQGALVESAKMSAVGSLAAGISHEFNNILVMMKGYVQLNENSQDIEALRKTIKIVKDLIPRGEQIVGGLLDFSRKHDAANKEVANIGEVLLKSISLMSPQFKMSNVIVSSNINQTPLIKCYPAQLAQVFVNLLGNAIDAMSQSKEKRISVELCHYKEADMEPGQQNFCGPSKECIAVRITDTGSGIPKEIENKIFEPFVTTKGVVMGGNRTRPGTGLGLSISYGIIKRHDGSISFTNNPGAGTSFLILIPVVTE